MTDSSEKLNLKYNQESQNLTEAARLSSIYQDESGSEAVKPYLQVENVNKKFGDFVALRDIYLDVYPGEFVCLLGPSGCGKTTLLRIIAGLETQTTGRVIQDNQDVSNLPPSKRDFGIVFQSYALFPNLTAAQNIAYGLENAKLPKQQIQAKVEELLNTVGLEGLDQKYAAQMSGGQQQRVALARALAQSPGLLLLDEPLSALDAKVRVKLRTEISQLQKRLGITTVMVTHDQSEALAMADRVVVMDKGYIAQVGTPHVVYQQPSSPFVANFIGVMNFLNGVMISPEQVQCGNIVLSTLTYDLESNQQVTIAIRPEDIRLLGNAEQGGNYGINVMTADIETSEFLGTGYLLSLTPEGNAKESIFLNVSIHEAREFDLRPGCCRVLIQFPPELIKMFC